MRDVDEALRAQVRRRGVDTSTRTRAVRVAGSRIGSIGDDARREACARAATAR